MQVSKVKISYKMGTSDSVLCTLKIYRDDDIIEGILKINMEDETISISVDDLTLNGYENIRLELLKEIFYKFVVRIEYILLGKHKYDFIAIDNSENKYQIAEYKLIEKNRTKKESETLFEELLKYDSSKFNRKCKREVVISYIKEAITQIMAYEEDNTEEIKNNGKLFIKFSDLLDNEEKGICINVLHEYFRNLEIKREEENLISDEDVSEEDDDIYYRGVDLDRLNDVECLCYKKMPVCEYELIRLNSNSNLELHKLIVEVFNKNKEEKCRREREAKEALEDDN